MNRLSPTELAELETAANRQINEGKFTICLDGGFKILMLLAELRERRTLPPDLDAVLERNREALARIGELPASEAALAVDESLRDVEALVTELRERRQAEVAATIQDLPTTL